MIAIINDLGESLQLSPEQSLVTEQAVAWLSDEELPAEFSYPIEAPLTDANKRFVQHGYRPDSASPVSMMAVNVQLEGTLYRRCQFCFKVAAGKLSGYLKIDASEFYDRIRKLSLLEALAEPVALGDGPFSEPLTSLQDRLRQLAALPASQFPCTFFPIRNEGMLEKDFSEEKLAGFTRSSYVNAWEKLEDGSPGFRIDLPDRPKFGYLLCPQFYLSYVLERIMNLAGYRLESDWLAHPETQRLTIKNLTAMSLVSVGVSGIFTGHLLTPGLFLPDMSVSEFLIAVKSRFGLVFTYNSSEKVCRITQFIDSVKAGPAVDLTAYQAGPYSTDYPAGNGFSVSEYIDQADQLYKDAAGRAIPPTTRTIGTGETPVTLKAGTCQLVNETSPLAPGARWFVPTVNQAGNVLDPQYTKSEHYLDATGTRRNAVGLCFLSYRGMTTDSLNNPYPLATPGVQDGHQVVVGTQALTLGGPYGSWQQGLKAYFYFRDQTQAITQPLLLPIALLASLPLHRSVSLSLDDQIRRSYLIGKLQAESPGIDGKVLVHLQALSLPAGLDLPADLQDATIWIEFKQVKSAQQPIGNSNVSGYEVYAAQTLLAWKDAARSEPVSVTNLFLQFRRKQKGAPTLIDLATPADTTYVESISYYTMSGASVELETHLLIDTKLVNHVRDVTLLDYSLDISLDPGDGYMILL